MQIAKYSVSLAGETYTPDEYNGNHNLVAIEIELISDANADQAKLIFGGGFNFNVKLGDPISIQVGEKDNLHQAMNGIVDHVGYQGTYVKVTANKPEKSLFALHYNQLYEQQSSGQIVKDILSRADITPGKIEDGFFYTQYPIHSKKCGYENVAYLAQKNGFFCFMGVDNTFHFMAPKEEAIKKNISFYEVVDLGHIIAQPKYEQILMYGEGSASKKGTETKHWLHTSSSDYMAKSGSGTPIIIEEQSWRNQDEAKQRSEAALKNLQRKKLQGKISILGAGELSPGDCITLQDFPSGGFNDTFMITKLKHVYNRKQGFLTHLNISKII